MILLSASEIQAGTVKGPAIARKQPTNASEPRKRVKVAKPQPEPSWRQLTREAKICADDAYLPLRVSILLRKLAAELEAAQTIFSKP